MAQRLDALVSEISKCRICCGREVAKPLPHEPRPVLRVSKTAQLAICGQAPGTRVHASGKPFTDPSGDRLRQWMGVNEDQFYDRKRVAIVPMGFCFPGLDAKGGDLPPRRECAATWHARVFESLPDLQLILLVGSYAQKWHLAGECRATLTDTVRSWREIYEAQALPRRIPMPHPSWRNNAWLKKNAWFEAELLPVARRDIQTILSS